ncbi:MAG: hypothetical protein A4E62_02140 [Syntrophorhabdus sp. PtaU1.Bin002]|nr:MAG: hypothetical protein A4E58_02212 [Syntrophorhabdus sp. PtaB.Bin006]OPY68026.1 MAG: hypothetical protein A4E62_02140 [Syntrophorhabdus sp. PtaU1.Bin002]
MEFTNRTGFALPFLTPLFNQDSYLILLIKKDIKFTRRNDKGVLQEYIDEADSDMALR